MLIKCPYCEFESVLDNWKIYLSKVCRIFNEQEVSLSYVCDWVKCPVCKNFVEFEADKELILSLNKKSVEQDIVKLKNAIESKEVDPDVKVIYCKGCNLWREFAYFKLLGIAKNESTKKVEIESEVFVKNELEIKPDKVIINKAKCVCCGNEIVIEPVEVSYPLSDDDKLKVFYSLKEKVVDKTNL